MLHKSHIAGALGILLAGAGCGGDLVLSTSNLEIFPNPARPGDMVVASFILTLIPTQRHTIVVYVDDTEYLRVTSADPPDAPMLLDIGDAADLIAAYGTGSHSAYVQVLLDDRDEAARTQSAGFELQETAP